MFHICKTENCWDVCNIISNAKFVIGTSLHVRILSAQYFRPRLTLFANSKQNAFIKDWDCIHNHNINIKDAADLYTVETLRNHNEELDREHLKTLEEDYLNKSTWINLLK